MPTFPIVESQIAALAQQIISGLTANAAVFTDPPVSAADLTTQLTAYTSARGALTAAQAAAKTAVGTKDAALDTLTDSMKRVLRYAENTVTPAQLPLIGWAPRTEPHMLLAPGQCRLLEAPQQGEGWVFLDWKEPLQGSGEGAGGAPAAYRIQRRERPSGPWMDVATAIASEITLTDQTRGKEFEYRVIAMNKSGDGAPSNTVLVVL